jgi:hypothetical protein
MDGKMKERFIRRRPHEYDPSPNSESAFSDDSEKQYLPAEAKRKRKITANSIFCFCVKRASSIYTLCMAGTCLLVGVYIGTFLVSLWNGPSLRTQDGHLLVAKPVIDAISIESHTKRIQGTKTHILM